MNNVLSNSTLLFLEDNLDFAYNTIIVLKQFIKNVYHAKSVEEADFIFSTNNIDIIISDIKLGNENSFLFIEKIRSMDSNIPIIILSGHKDEEYLFSAIPLNLTDYLLKPIKFNQLIETFDKCSKQIESKNKSYISLKEGWIYNFDNKYLIDNNGLKFTLNRKEMLLIEYIIENPDKLITKNDFYAYIWEYEEMSDSALRNFLLRIRKRFGKSFIHTLPNLGYKF